MAYEEPNFANVMKGHEAPMSVIEEEIAQVGTKMTARERKWVMYDVGNSAFALLSASVIPIYANSLLHAAGKDNIVSSWGYANTVASLLIAILMPFLGSLADVQGMKIKFFIGFLSTGVTMCFAMALPLGWLPFLVFYIFATVGFNGSLTFYDSMLVDTTTNDRMDRISANGYGWGYIGSTVPFLFSLALILGGNHIGIGKATATQIAFAITAIWWIAFTIPLLTSYKQRHYRTTAHYLKREIRNSFNEIRRTIREILNNKPLRMFMLAFFFYIDAINTIIAMATSYGAQLGINSTQLILALLATQFVAFPCAIYYGRLASKFGAKNMIIIAIIAYMCIVMFASFFLHSALEFWILAITVGMFQGGIQALSRSYFGKIIPKHHANEYYGFYDIFGKYASIMGTLLVAVTTQVTGRASLGVLSIGILLAIALTVLLLQRDPTVQPS